MSPGFLSRKKLLITGGTGHLGSALCHYLVHTLLLEPSDIRVFYLAGSAAPSLAEMRGLNLVAGNVLHFADVQRACEGVDYVFHLAGSTSFDPRQKRLQWLVNVEGTRNVLEAVRRSPAFKKMCFTSTVNTLGVPDPAGSIGDLENSSPYAGRPRLHSFRSAEEVLRFMEEIRNRQRPGWERHIRLGYFDSKLAAQELVQLYAMKLGVEVVSVLPGTCFGPYDFLIGNGLYLLALYHGRMPGVLKGGFSTAHVMDVAAGHVRAMEFGTKGSRYIITGAAEDNLYLKDLAGIIVEILRQKFPGRKIRRPRLVWPIWLAWSAAFLSERYAGLTKQANLLSRDMVRAGSVPLFYSYAKAAREIGYLPRRTFREAVREMADYYQDHNLFEGQARLG